MLRILQEISERVRPHAAEIANDAWIIGHLDLIRARFDLSKKDKQSCLSCQKIKRFNCSMSAILWSKMPSQMMSILVKI